MKKNIIANSLNIAFSVVFLVAVFLLQLNPLSLITALIVTVTNMLLAVYSMGISEHPVIKIGPVSGSVYFFNIATFILQILMVAAALSSSVWVTILCLFGALVYLECLSLFLKDLFRAMKFHIAVTLSISFVTLILYSVLRVYRDFSFQIPTLPVALLFMAVYVYFMIKEKDFLKLTAYSAIFSEAVVLLSLGNYASQNIYGTILCLVGFTPVMFLLLLAAFTIEQTYQSEGEKEIGSVFVHFPVTGTGYLVGLLAILGFPPFSLFFGRLTILQSAVTAENWWSASLLAVVFAVSSYFLLTKAMPKLFGSRKDVLLTVKEKSFHNAMIIVLLVLVVVLTILTPGFIDSLASDARAYVLGVLS